MSLKAFFKENAIQQGQVKRFVVSDRFMDEEGNPVPWELKALSPKEWNKIASGAVSTTRKGEVQMKDTTELNFHLCEKVIQYPNLHDKELQDSYGVMGVGELLDKMLTSGEFQRLMRKITEMHRADTTLDEMADEVKND